MAASFWPGACPLPADPTDAVAVPPAIIDHVRARSMIITPGAAFTILSCSPIDWAAPLALTDKEETRESRS